MQSIGLNVHSDYYFSPEVKTALKGKRFQDFEEFKKKCGGWGGAK
jgi:hypothetical protein